MYSTEHRSPSENLIKSNDEYWMVQTLYILVIYAYIAWVVLWFPISLDSWLYCENVVKSKLLYSVLMGPKLGRNTLPNTCSYLAPCKNRLLICPTFKKCNTRWWRRPLRCVPWCVDDRLNRKTLRCVASAPPLFRGKSRDDMLQDLRHFQGRTVKPGGSKHFDFIGDISLFICVEMIV